MILALLSSQRVVVQIAGRTAGCCTRLLHDALRASDFQEALLIPLRPRMASQQAWIRVSALDTSAEDHAVLQLSLAVC